MFLSVVIGVENEMRTFNLSPELKAKIQSLNPDKSKEFAIKKFAYNRFRTSVIVLVSLLVLSAIIFIEQLVKEKNENLIRRGDYGEVSQIVTRKFQLGDSEEKNLDIEVFAREYSKEQADEIFNQIKLKLPKIILGDNKSLNEVRSPLNLIKDFDNKGISIYWSSEDDGLIGNDGQVFNMDIGDEGRKIQLEYRIQCGEFIDRNYIEVTVFPPIFTKEEAILQSLYQSVNNEEANSRTQEFYSLPDKINGVEIKWSSKNKNIVLPLIVFAVILSVLVYYLQGKRLDEQLKLRKRQLLSDYYEIANKMILYIEAGVSSKLAFNKLAKDYLEYKKENKTVFRYAYEEILIMCREIQSGVSELTAYENCGKRCGLMQYKKLFGYLAQSIKKGSSFVIDKLKSEMQDAFEERKANAVRLGEEASTKLMLPMLMMLSIVIAILIIPAFIAFGV